MCVRTSTSNILFQNYLGTFLNLVTIAYVNIVDVDTEPMRAKTNQALIYWGKFWWATPISQRPFWRFKGAVTKYWTSISLTPGTQTSIIPFLGPDSKAAGFDVYDRSAPSTARVDRD